MIGVNLQLFDGATQQASLSNIQALWWDVEEPKDGSRPAGRSDAVTTDATGYINLDLSNVSGLTVGSSGFLLLYKLDDSDHEDSLVFSGKVATSDIESGIDMYYYDSGWIRPVDWPSLSDNSDGVQKISGLFAVYDRETDGNKVILECSAAYHVVWGDGASEDVASGTSITHAYDYDDAHEIF